jgi:hypothetical protein
VLAHPEGQSATGWCYSARCASLRCAVPAARKPREYIHVSPFDVYVSPFAPAQGRPTGYPSGVLRRCDVVRGGDAVTNARLVRKLSQDVATEAGRPQESGSRVRVTPLRRASTSPCRARVTLDDSLTRLYVASDQPNDGTRRCRLG